MKATVTPTPAFPFLMQNRHNPRLVILATGPGFSPTNTEGVIVATNHDDDLGKHGKGWVTSHFEPFLGTIHLEN